MGAFRIDILGAWYRKIVWGPTWAVLLRIPTPRLK